MDTYNQNRMEKYIQKDWKNYQNFINCLIDRKNRRTKIANKPFIMYLDPTSFCNLQCPFCTTGQRINGRSSTSMSLKHFEEIITYFGSDLFHVTLYSWGEPLLNKDFFEMVKVLKKFHISSDVSTNISFPVTKEKVNEIVTCGLDKIAFSIDGNSQKIYEKYRIGGNIEQVFKNLERIIQAHKNTKSKTKLLWRYLVFKHNQHEINDAKKRASELGIEIAFEPGFFDPKKKNEWEADGEFIRDFWPYDENEITITQESQIELAREKAATLFPKLKFPLGCDWLWYASTVNANGNISPCCITTLESQDFDLFDKNSLINKMNNQKFVNARKITIGEKYEKNNLICERCPAIEVWHQLDETIIPIIMSLIKKLPKEYNFLKEILPKKVKPPGELNYYYILEEINAYTIGWLKKIIDLETKAGKNNDFTNSNRNALSCLYEIFSQREDLQNNFKEITDGEFTRIIEWVNNHGIYEEQKLQKYQKFLNQINC